MLALAKAFQEKAGYHTNRNRRFSGEWVSDLPVHIWRARPEADHFVAPSKPGRPHLPAIDSGKSPHQPSFRPLVQQGQINELNTQLQQLTAPYTDRVDPPRTGEKMPASPARPDSTEKGILKNEALIDAAFDPGDGNSNT